MWQGRTVYTVRCGYDMIYDMIYNHPVAVVQYLYTQTIQRTTQNNHYIEKHKNTQNAKNT